MSHSLQLPGGWTAIHNGDFSGDICFLHEGKAAATVPFEVIRGVVAQAVRNEKISRLEQASDGEILKGF